MPILGPEHPYTLDARHSSGWWRSRTGHPGAATAAEQLLEDCERILGAEHPHTLIARHSLAWRRGEAGTQAARPPSSR
ncbi:hypothetical protein Ate01nite_28620 [Actinoplanes teichomyceticus]|nr:hypothetical protein Ate01nite_28620 [Actinoplanes teichomyceticus]